MSEFSITNTIKNIQTQNSSIFFFLVSSIVSHPLYFSYFIFFLPYIVKLITFLSPFFTTISLLLALLTFSHGFCETSESKLNEEFEEFEVYKIVFDVSTFEIGENLVMDLQQKSEEICVDKHCLSSGDLNQALLGNSEEYKEKEVEEQKEQSTESGSKVIDSKRNELADLAGRLDNDEITENSEKFVSNLGSFGLMRKEKEWKRTLEFKLFEERRNKEEDEECMDSLWETYETDSSKMKSKKNHVLNFNEDEDEEEEDDSMDGPICCLQALKFSGGKMNLGMGKTNFVKISKAFKGFSFLHQKSKIGKRK